MTKSKIREIALANGFKLKKQPDGSEDLNPYVYDMMVALLDAAREYAASKVNPDDIADEYDWALYEFSRIIKEAE